MSVSLSLANQFLIAMPTLRDPNFFHTVTYICEHGDEGALGIVINRPMDLTLGEVLDHMSIEVGRDNVAARPLFWGGPVQPERGFVVHHPPGMWESSLQITPSIAVTTSKDILTAIANGIGPSDSIIALGYAGWGPGQLEKEISENAWLSGPADEKVIFSTPYERRWEAAARLMGVDLRLLSNDVGHA